VAGEFAKYQAPQYELLNRGMGLAGFKTIYWWEWTHRLLGRLLGVFLVPFLVFLRQGRIDAIAVRLGSSFSSARRRACWAGGWWSRA
jgi:cytochrome c oxidase assembly protein subunit 15